MNFKILLPLLIVLVILAILYRRYGYRENLEFNKNRFIINNRYLFDLSINTISISILRMDLYVDRKTGKAALVDLELLLNSNEYSNVQIKKNSNSFKILKRFKEYNKVGFETFMNEQFGNNESLKKLIESDIQDA